jgi:hypothetical protein
VFVRDQVRDCVLRTFGDSIYQDLWKHLDHTVRKQEGCIVVDNLYRFGGKQCSNPLDLVYSILSISTDGPRLQVDYDVSVPQLVRNVFRLLENELCLVTAAKVLRSLSVFNDKESSPSEPVVNIEALLIETVDHHGCCNTCTTKFDLFTLSEADMLAKTYVRCLRCSHTKATSRDDYFHLLVIETRELETSLSSKATESLWRVFLYDHKLESRFIKLGDGLRIIPPDTVTQSVVVCLTLTALHKLSDACFGYVDSYISRAWLPRSLEQTGTTHDVDTGWTLAD